MRKIAFTTLGCKTNHYDSDQMALACRQAGWTVVGAVSKPDVHVVNTCTVTSSSDAQCRNVVRRIIRANPNAVIIVSGCSSQNDPAQFASIQGVHYVIGVRATADLLGILRDNFGTLSESSADNSPIQKRARAFLKIQDGCDRRCTYCAVWRARGPSRSIPQGVVVQEMNRLVKEGFREIILTGVHIGRYGRDFTPNSSLAELLKELLNSSGDCRLRLSSLDPDELNDEMIALIGDPNICSHLHISLQSGSDDVLKMMGRNPETDRYGSVIASLAKKIPDISIGADIIAGFPGETDEYFEQTYQFVKSLPFSYLHIFPFSPRPSTAAFDMENQIPERIRKERAIELKNLSLKKRKTFYESQVGKIRNTVVASTRKDSEGFFKCITDNYIPLFVREEAVEYREIVSCRLLKLRHDITGIEATITR